MRSGGADGDTGNHAPGSGHSGRERTRGNGSDRRSEGGDQGARAYLIVGGVGDTNCHHTCSESYSSCDTPSGAYSTASRGAHGHSGSGTSNADFDTHSNADFDTHSNADFDTHSNADFDTHSNADFDTHSNADFDTRSYAWS